MTEPTHTPDGEVATYVRVAPSPVTARSGQGTGDRAGDKPPGGPPEEGPRADASRGARARGRSVADHWLLTLRDTASGGGRVTRGARTAALAGLTDVRARWDYLRNENWMRESDNTVLRICGYLLAVSVAIPLTIAARLVQTVVTLVADTVAAIASRFAVLLAALAIGAAVWFVWPVHHAAPPTAATEVITPAGAQ